MKRLNILLLFLFVCVFASAQTQQGYVKTRGKLAANGASLPGARIAGVTLNVKNGTSYVSGSNGTFSFALQGKSYSITSVQKKGYQLCDPDMLHREYRYSANPFIVVMQDPEVALADRLESERKIRRVLSRQLQEKEDELDALREQQKITEKEYQKRLQTLMEQQSNNEDLITKMAERYSTLDFDQLDDFQRQVAFFIQNGELTRADSLLNTKGSMADRSAELDRMDAAIKADAAELERRQKAHDESVALKAKTLADFAADCYSRYEICRLQHKNDSAAYWLELRASKDTANIEWMLEAGVMYDVYCAQPDKAKQIFMRAYDTAVHVYGETNRSTVLCLRNLAASAALDNKYAEALSYYERERQVLQDTYGEDWQSESLDWYTNVATVVMELGEYDKAIDYNQRSIDAIIAFKGECVTELFRSYNNLASVYNRVGDYKKALDLYQKALELVENQESPDAEHLATIHNNLGLTYTHLEQRDLSLAEHELAYGYFVKAYGEEHPNVSIALNAIGTGHYRKGDLNEAYKYFRKALGIMLDSYGEYQILTATIYHNIAMVFSDADMHEDAVEMLNKEMAIKQLLLGEDNVGLANVYEMLGGEYDYLGKTEEAKKYMLIGLEKHCAALGEDNVNLVTAYINLATVFSREKDHSQAEAYFKKAISILTKEYGESSEYLADAYDNWGVMLFREGEYNKAHSLFVKALNISCEIRGEDHARTNPIYINLANTCLSLKQFREAIDYRYKSLGYYVKTYGHDNPHTINSYMNLTYYYQEALKANETKVSFEEYAEFFADLMYVADFVEGDTPARQQGLGGEYYLFRFEDWTPESLESLESINEELRGKSKTLVVMDKDGHVTSHHFENTIGASFSIKYVGKEEKQRLMKLFQLQ